MNYQIGNQCLPESTAENLYFSSVVPAVSSDGSIIRPEYKNGIWQMNGQHLSVAKYLPPCSHLDNFKAGSEIGWQIFGLMAALYLFITLKGLLK